MYVSINKTKALGSTVAELFSRLKSWQFCSDLVWHIVIKRTESSMTIVGWYQNNVAGDLSEIYYSL